MTFRPSPKTLYQAIEAQKRALHRKTANAQRTARASYTKAIESLIAKLPEGEQGKATTEMYHPPKER